MVLTQYWNPITIGGVEMPTIYFGVILFAVVMAIFGIFHKMKG